MFIIGGNGQYQLEASEDTQVLELEDSPSGHSMLPVTEFARLSENSAHNPLVFSFQGCDAAQSR